MSIIRLTRQENLPCERQGKFVLERLASAENALSDLCQRFGEYAKKAASLRDKNDDLAITINKVATDETIGKSSKVHLKEFADHLATVGDYRDILIQTLSSKVIQEICQYEVICRNARDEVKAIFGAKDRESNRRRKLQRLKEQTPHNRQQIYKAEADLVKAKAEVSHMQKSLEEHIEVFEIKKVQDIKSMLSNFLEAEITFHAQALNCFTKAYACINQIDEQADINEFRHLMALPLIEKRLETVRKLGGMKSPENEDEKPPVPPIRQNRCHIHSTDDHKKIQVSEDYESNSSYETST